ncbi:hypothetical protein L7F22_040806 [Adiantum nelumboides]|nr:hypothetical protein [Adiantum nelumboides]
MHWRYFVSPVLHASTGTSLMAPWQDQMMFLPGPGDFTWLRPRETCRYLGFQVGLDVTPEQQSPVMQSTRRKLCYWSTQHLSLAGRALMANQVLLASAWYVASCWKLHGGVMRQLRQLIGNFLYGGSDGAHDTRARVRLSTVIMPTSLGGLGITDPEMQSRALLTKLIVRGLFPSNEPWKILLQSDLETVTPTYGVRDDHIWTPGMRFLFTDAPACGAFIALVATAIPTLNAMRRAAVALERLADTAREELPGMMAAVRLSGMEISDLTLELSDMSQEISESVRSSARAVRAAEVGIRRMGSVAASQTLSILQEHASMPVEAVRPVVANAAETTRQAMSQAHKAVLGLAGMPVLSNWIQKKKFEEQKKIDEGMSSDSSSELDKQGDQDLMVDS